MKNPISCENSDLDYVEFVSNLSRFIGECLDTGKNKNYEQAVDLYSDDFVKFFPEKDDLSLDQVSEKYFYGKYAEPMAFIYSQLMDLWFEVQEIEKNLAFGIETTDLSEDRFREFLEVQKDKLETLIKKF